MRQLAWVALLALAPPGSARAQNMDQIGPRPVPRTSASGRVAEPRMPEDPGSEETLLSGLRGLLFVPSVAAVRREGVAGADGVHAEGLPLLEQPDFQSLMAPHLGQPASLRTLTQIQRETVLYYRAHDRPVVDVFVPEQDVTSGVVQVVVLEGHLGEVRATGARWFDDAALVRQVRVAPGDSIRMSRLREDLDRLNENPFRRVDAVLAPGRELGATDVELRTEDRFPVRTYAGWEDTGTELTGLWRWFAGANWGDAFGLGHLLDYQYTASPDGEGLRAHSASYWIPLPWRHRLIFFGGYANSKADAGDPSDLTGFGWQASSRYEVPLRAFVEGLRHDLYLGTDFKRTNNNLDFGGANVFDTTFDVAQGVLGYRAAAPDPWGSTRMQIQAFFSPGGLSTYDHNANYEEVRGGARPDYIYGNLDLTRITGLPWGFQWYARGGVQWTGEELMPTEQLGLGGAYTVRGYDERIVNGDRGWWLSHEIRTPSLHPAQWLGVGWAQDALQLLAFWDGGRVALVDSFPGETIPNFLTSVGLGVRYQLLPWISIRYDYGWELRSPGVPGYSRTSRGHLGVMLAFTF
jgi:hemolysin activation/secretion protein